jgi:hypothetical protein
VKIVTAYVPGSLRIETEEALIAAANHYFDKTGTVGGLEWKRHIIDPDDPYDYGHKLREHWRNGGDDLFIVEPDIVVRPDAISEIMKCDCIYGGFPYPWVTDVGIALGCTWFKREFIQKYPTLLDEAVNLGITWKQLDTTVQRKLLVAKYGEQPHVHLPAVAHLNEAKALLPEASPIPLMELPSW